MIAICDICATAVLVVHALWIVWVVTGPFLAGRRRRLRLLHLACVLATLGSQAAGVCPLTDLEQKLQMLAGRAGYTGGFIEHYASMFVYGELVTFPPAAMVVGLVTIVAGSLWVYNRDRLTA